MGKMQCNYNVDAVGSAKFIEDLKTNPFAQIDGKHIWSLGYNTEPFNKEYVEPEGFPNCCNYHKNELVNLQSWINKFPDCCTNHKELRTRAWFKKEDYRDIPLKVLKELCYTEQFIDISLTSDNWYKEVTDYIEYCFQSFGTPNIGGEQYLKSINHWVKMVEASELEFPSQKRKQISSFIKKLLDPPKRSYTDLNILNAVCQKWLKTIPDFQFFNNLKEGLKAKMPFAFVLYEPEYNRFTGLTAMKVRTEGELVENLIMLTKKLLSVVDTPIFLKNGFISDKGKYEIDLLNNAHQMKQNKLLGGYSKEEIKYVKIIKRWLKNEKEYLASLKQYIKTQTTMPKLFEFEERETAGKPYLKVFLKEKSRIKEVVEIIGGLQSVRKANVTENKEIDITVYPARTYSIEELKSEIKIALESYLTGSPLDPVFIDGISSLSDKGYEDILNHIREYGNNLEKYKNLYDKFDEEGFRDFFLPHLNAISRKHSATGETFNKKGKTDILIQDNNGNNVFVAECKLWKGESELLKAVSQLLDRYVTWRDERVALIIFNKAAKRFTEILTKASEKIKEHDQFISYIGSTTNTSFRYMFKHSEDEDRKITLELIIFNCT